MARKTLGGAGVRMKENQSRKETGCQRTQDKEEDAYGLAVLVIWDQVKSSPKTQVKTGNG